MSYYKLIDGVAYDRKMLGLAQTLAQANGDKLAMGDADLLMDLVLDGGTSTEVELRSATYILQNLSWEDDARQWFSASLPVPAEAAVPSADAVRANHRIREILGIAADGTIPGGTLTVDAQTFAELDPDGRVAAMLDSAFAGPGTGSPTLVIENASANAEADNPVCVVVCGAAGFSLAREPVDAVLVLTMANGCFDALVTFRMDARGPWTFEDSFDDLPTILRADEPGQEPRSVLADLQLSNVRFIVTTLAQRHADQMLVPGINFRAEMALPGLMAALATGAIDASPIRLVGTILLSDAGAVAMPPLLEGEFPWRQSATPSGIDLQAAIGSHTIGLGDAGTISTGTLRIYSPASTASFAANPTYRPVLGYIGSVEIPALGDPVDITLDSPPGLAAAEVTADFSATKLAHLDQLATAIGLSSLTAMLPQALAQGLDGLGLQDIRIVIDYGAGIAVERIAARIALGSDWTILDGDEHLPSMVVEEPTCDIEVLDPFRAPQPIVVLRGHVSIGNVRIAVKTQAPDFQLYAALDEEVAVPFARVAAALGLGDLPVGALSIDTLSAMIDPENAFRASVSLADAPAPWTIALGSSGLTFQNISLDLNKVRGSPVQGQVSANATIGSAVLDASFDLSGDLRIEGSLGPVHLSEIVDHLVGSALAMPAGFDLLLDQAYARIEKRSETFDLALGADVAGIGSVCLMVQKAESWGFALAGELDIDGLGTLPAVGPTLQSLADWFPLDNIMLVVSSIDDSGFKFPSVTTPAGSTQLTLPPIANGLTSGFFLFAVSRIDRKKPITRMLADLLHLEGEVDAFVAYDSARERLRLGLAVSTALTDHNNADAPPATVDGPDEAAYYRSQLIAKLYVELGEGDDLQIELEGELKTRVAGNDLDFDVKIAVAPDGILLSATSLHEIAFAPLSIGQLALAFGISEEGLPSFGFSGEISYTSQDPAYDFDSSVAVMIDTGLPERSMVAGALSDLRIGALLDHFLEDADKSDIAVPDFIHQLDAGDLGDFLRSVAIVGPKGGSFTIAAEWRATALPRGAPAGSLPLGLADALTQLCGPAIAEAFRTVDPDFPQSTPELMVMGAAQQAPAGSRIWFITAHKAGQHPVHWQLTEQANGDIRVAKEAQLYLVPDPAGIDIGALHYDPGFLVAGRIEIDLVKVEVVVDIDKSRGVSIDASLDRIDIGGPDPVVSLTGHDGEGGPRFSLSTYEQPLLEDTALRPPHFLIDGAVHVLGSRFDAYVYLTAKGGAICLDLDTVNGLSGSLSGFLNSSGFNLAGSLALTSPTLSLGEDLGTLSLPADMATDARIWCNADDMGASYHLSLTLIGQTVEARWQADLSVHRLEDIADEIESQAVALAKSVLKTGLALATACKQGLIDGVSYTADQTADLMHNGWNFVAADAVAGVANVYGLDAEAMQLCMTQAGYPPATLAEAINEHYGIEEENRKLNQDTYDISNIHPVDHPLDATKVVVTSGADMALQSAKADGKILGKTVSDVFGGLFG